MALAARLPGTALVRRLENLPGLAGRLVADTGPLAALSASLHLPFYREVRVLASYRTLRRHPISGGTRLLTEAQTSGID